MANPEERKLKTTTVHSIVEQKHVINAQPIITPRNKAHLKDIVGSSTAPSIVVSSHFFFCLLLTLSWLLGKFWENRCKGDFQVTRILHVQRKILALTIFIHKVTTWRNSKHVCQYQQTDGKTNEYKTLWKFCRKQQKNQMSEVNSHQDFYIHCSVNKFYALYTSFLKSSKETERNPNIPIYLTVQTGIILPHINRHSRESFGKCEGSLFWQHLDQTAELAGCVVPKKILAHIHDIYSLLVKKTESAFILRENKPKPNKLLIIVIIRKLTWILQISV